MRALWMLLLLAACATPPQGDLFTQPPPPQPGYATLVAYYDPCCLAGFAPVTFSINDTPQVASVSIGGYSVISLAADATYTLTAGDPSPYSPTVTVSPKSGDVIFARYYLGAGSSTLTGSPVMPVLFTKTANLELVNAPNLSRYRIQPAIVETVRPK